MLETCAFLSYPISTKFALAMINLHKVEMLCFWPKAYVRKEKIKLALLPLLRPGSVFCLHLRNVLQLQACTHRACSLLVFASPGQGDSGRLSVIHRRDWSSPAGARRGGSPLPSSAPGPRPRPGEGEGSPRRKPASWPAQNTPPPKTFFSQLRATFCLFSQHGLVPSFCPLGFPRLPSLSPQRGEPGLTEARGARAAEVGTEEEKGKGKRGGGGRGGSRGGTGQKGLRRAIARKGKRRRGLLQSE